MIVLLVLGVLVWSLVHFFPAVMADKRNQLNDSMGNKYQGLFALVIVFSIVLIVLGWRGSEPLPVYNPPVWGRHLTMLLILIAVILFGAANASTKLRQYIRHPMLSGILVWGVGHLLANGDIRSVILFGGMIIWAILSIALINRRDGAWQKPTVPAGWLAEVKLVAISLVIYLALVLLHPYFTGMPIA